MAEEAPKPLANAISSFLAETSWLAAPRRA
jgi:hypothetical protein